MGGDVRLPRGMRCAVHVRAPARWAGRRDGSDSACPAQRAAEQDGTRRPALSAAAMAGLPGPRAWTSAFQRELARDREFGFRVKAMPDGWALPPAICTSLPMSPRIRSLVGPVTIFS